MERHSRKKLIITVFKEFFQERSFLHGAALAYYAVFALVPILYLSVAVFGRLVGHNTMVEIITKFLNEQIGLADVSGILDFLNTMQLSKGNVLMEVIGILALMISSTAILNSLRMSINDFYDLEKLKGRRRKIVRGLLFRLLSMAFIAGATVVLVVFYFAETVFLSLGNDLLADYDTLNRIFAFAAHMGIPLLANTIVFACVFKFLHDGKVVWRRAIEGALITGILLYLGQLIIQYYLTNHFFGSGGGVVGTILIILVWVYYSSQIIFLGAKYIAVKSRISGQTIQLRD